MHYENKVINRCAIPAKDDKSFDQLYDYRRMRRDGGKFRPKHTMPGISPCVIHTEHPGSSPEERRTKMKN